LQVRNLDADFLANFANRGLFQRFSRFHETGHEAEAPRGEIGIAGEEDLLLRYLT
jgi:hypothetical protein